MALLFNINPKDLEFIATLDERLRPPGESSAEHHQIGRKDTDRLLRVLERNDFAFYPTSLQNEVGFQVVSPRVKGVLLTFTESQLPKGYDFTKLSRYFMCPSNLQRTSSLKIKVMNDRKYYLSKSDALV